MEEKDIEKPKYLTWIFVISFFVLITIWATSTAYTHNVTSVDDTTVRSCIGYDGYRCLDANKIGDTIKIATYRQHKELYSDSCTMLGVEPYDNGVDIVNIYSFRCVVFDPSVKIYDRDGMRYEVILH